MFCSKCGAEMKETEVFCSGCGTQNVKVESKNSLMTSLSGLNVVGDKSINFVGIIASAVAFIALFLPYIKVDFFGLSESNNLISTGSGKFLLILILATAALYVIKRDKIALITAAINMVVILYVWIDAGSMIKESYGMAKLSFGFFLYLLSAAVILAVGILRQKQK